MKRLSILLFFIALMVPPCHEPGTSMAQDATECLDTFPQQCRESVQLAKLTLPMVGGSVPVVAPPAGISDDFTTDPASRWTKLVGSNWTWDNVSGNVDMVAESTYLYNTQTSTVSQWACVQLTVESYNGVVLRSTGNIGDYYYIAKYNSGSDNPEWRYCLGASCSTVQVDTYTDNFVSGDYLCAEVSGTGTDTIVEIWRFTSVPPARGSWGDSTSGQMTDDPAQVANTGKYVGLYTEDNATFDNFSAGDIE